MARVAQRCLISLGRLAFAQGDYTTAEAALRHAVAAGKAMRVPLPAGEILAAFARERVAPFAELARLCLDDPRGSRVAEAFGYVEAGRARAFLEMLGGAPQLLPAGYQPDPANLERACELRVEQLALSRLAAPSAARRWLRGLERHLDTIRLSRPSLPWSAPLTLSSPWRLLHATSSRRTRGSKGLCAPGSTPPPPLPLTRMALRPRKVATR